MSNRSLGQFVAEQVAHTGLESFVEASLGRQGLLDVDESLDDVVEDAESGGE